MTSIREYAPHEIARLRQLADSLPWETQQKFHTLIDVYEERAETMNRLEEAKKTLENLAEELEDSLEDQKREGPTEKLKRLEEEIELKARELENLAGTFT